MGKSRRGFTLVELAIVIAILGLIAVVAVPPGNTTWLHAPHDISVAIKGDHPVISVDGWVVLDFHDTAFPSGMAGLRGWDGCNPSFSAVSVTPNP
jgi:prepilin-type N-terminal cleavage/methylation domain-containing protein